MADHGIDQLKRLASTTQTEESPIGSNNKSAQSTIFAR